MKIRIGLALGILPVLLCAFFYQPAVTHAAPTLTAAETVANVAESTIPAITFAGGVTQTAASTTITIADGMNASATDHSITIDGVTIDLGSSALTAAQVADKLVYTTWTGGTVYATKPYTVATTSATVVAFTRSTASGTTGNGALTIADASYTKTNAVAASATITITAGLDVSAADHSVQVDGLGAIDLGASALTAAQVGDAIRAGITGAGGYAAKSYTVSGSGATITFTRKAGGTAGNGSITIDDAAYTTGTIPAITLAGGVDVVNGTVPAITLANAVDGVAATANVVMPHTLDLGATDHSVTIDGVTIDLGTAALTAAQVADKLVYATWTGGTTYATKAYTVATTTTTNVRFTRSSTGATGNTTVTVADADYNGVAQQMTFTAASPEGDYNYRVVINGHVYKVTADSNAFAISQLTDATASDADVTCTKNDAVMTCVAKVPGTAFSYEATTDSTGSSGGHGGGGSVVRTTTTTDSTSSLEAQIATLQAQLQVLLTQAAAQGVSVSAAMSGSFTRDLDVGASGADVRALQSWLNGHGFPVAASGVGSAGHETETFGGLTRAALAKWQASVGISPAAGYFGAKTRAYLAAHQ